MTSMSSDCCSLGQWDGDCSVLNTTNNMSELSSVEDISKTCRFCKANLFSKGRLTNIRSIFKPARNPEKTLAERFQEVGVNLPQIPGVFSSRLCTKCYRKFEGVEEAVLLLNQWKAVHNHYHTPVKETGDGTTEREREKRLRDTPFKTPRKKLFRVDSTSTTSKPDDHDRSRQSHTTVSCFSFHTHTCTC